MEMLFVNKLIEKIKEKSAQDFSNLVDCVKSLPQEPHMKTKDRPGKIPSHLNDSSKDIKYPFRASSDSVSKTKRKSIFSKAGQTEKGKLPQISKNRSGPLKARANNNSENILKQKKQLLLLELEAVDYEIRLIHANQSQYQRRKNKTEHNQSPIQQAKALQLIHRMNNIRKENLAKKSKEAELVQIQVEETIQKFKELAEQRKEEELKRKIEIQRRIQERKFKMKQRERINRKADGIIRQTQKYRIMLPDIYFKHAPQSILLTQAESSLPKSQQKQEYKKSARLHILDKNAFSHQRLKLEKQKEEQIKKEYQKRIKEKQLEFGKKLRLQIKGS